MNTTANAQASGGDVSMDGDEEATVAVNNGGTAVPVKNLAALCDSLCHAIEPL